MEIIFAVLGFFSFVGWSLACICLGAMIEADGKKKQGPTWKEDGKEDEKK